MEYLAITHAGLYLLRKEENQFQIMQTLTWVKTGSHTYLINVMSFENLNNAVGVLFLVIT